VHGKALADLQASRAILEARAAEKRRLILDADVHLVELGLRMQARGNRLSEADAQTFRRVARHRKHLLATHGQFQSLLANIEAQIVHLGDMPALEHSFGTLAASVGARAQRVADTRAMLSSIATDMETLLTSRNAVKALDGVLSVDAAEDELEKLMHSSALSEALDRVQRQLAEAPSPPAEAPSFAGDAEAALGLEPALLA